MRWIERFERDLSFRAACEPTSLIRKREISSRELLAVGADREFQRLRTAALVGKQVKSILTL